ncbi:MAG: threonine synthase [Candidatus Bathyarchaeia archaeon]
MFVDRVECTKCGEVYEADKALTVCRECGGALIFQYDLAKASEKISKNVLERRKETFWKFTELLPISSPKNVVSLGEPYTPILQISLNKRNYPKNVFAKDDGRLPTGTFKARGIAVTVSKLKELDINHVVIPSAGNAAAALAAYGAAAGMSVHVFMPKDAPKSNLKECLSMGARVFLVEGLINDAAAVSKKLSVKYGWFDVSTNKQPYRFEGYKAAAFEIAEQFKWDPPDAVIFPTGGGEGVIGLWKGFKDLMELGWTGKIPRLIIVQSTGCAPLVKAYNNGDIEVREPWENAETLAAGLRVPFPYASYLTLRAIRETKGSAVAVSDAEIISSMEAFFKKGIYACPEAASTLSALYKLIEGGEIDQSEKVLLYLTGNAMKYFDLLKMDKSKITQISKETDSLLL